MLELIGVIVAAAVLSLAVIGVVVFIGMRRRSPAILRAVRQFSRTVVNPRMLATAGTPGAYASLIHHVGRTTGRDFRTPVVAAPTADGFVIALPYGTTSNWVRNVLASGSATLVHEGVTYRVDQPELVPLSSVNQHFPPKERRSHTRFRVAQCMRLRRLDDPVP
jgi:hypothetical protein